MIALSKPTIVIDLHVSKWCRTNLQSSYVGDRAIKIYNCGRFTDFPSEVGQIFQRCQHNCPWLMVVAISFWYVQYLLNCKLTLQITKASAIPPLARPKFFLRLRHVSTWSLVGRMTMCWKWLGILAALTIQNLNMEFAHSYISPSRMYPGSNCELIHSRMFWSFRPRYCFVAQILMALEWLPTKVASS